MTILRESHWKRSSKSHNWGKSSRHTEEEVEVFHLVSDRFRKVMDLKSYLLAHLSAYYYMKVAKHVAK